MKAVSFLEQTPYLPFINLPNDFCSLLKDYRQDIGFTKRLDLFIQQRKALHRIITFHMQDIDKEGRVEVLIKSLGHSGFRDRLAIIFLSYLQSGHYFQQSNILIKDLLVFEDRLRAHTFEGHCRPFLLAFYLKTIAIKEGIGMHHLFPAHLFNYFKYLQVKLQGIDWPFIFLWHFDRVLGEKKLTTLLSQNSSFQYIWSLLSNDEKSAMMQSLVSYGLSINDKDIFSRHVGSDISRTDFQGKA
jgi:hypothetical protein